MAFFSDPGHKISLLLPRKLLDLYYFWKSGFWEMKYHNKANEKANQNDFINEWWGESESWIYKIILICQVMSCDISFHKNHFFRNFISKIIVYDGLCNKFWEMILRNDFEKWYIMALVPWYIISQNHFSKFGCLCFVYIHLQWWAGP